MFSTNARPELHCVGVIVHCTVNTTIIVKLIRLDGLGKQCNKYLLTSESEAVTVKVLELAVVVP